MATWHEMSPWGRRWWTVFAAGIICMALAGFSIMIEAATGAASLNGFRGTMTLAGFGIGIIGLIGLFCRGMMERLWPTPPRW